MKMIDLRSDTVTKPSDAMRQKMLIADVGDDVMGEDPTVNSLEEYAANPLGKESALFAGEHNLKLHLDGARTREEIDAVVEAFCEYFKTGSLSANGNNAQPQSVYQ